MRTIYVDTDRRSTFRELHREDLAHARRKFAHGLAAFGHWHLQMAVYHRMAFRDELRFHKINDVRLIDGMSWVQSGGFLTVECSQ